MYDFLVVGAGLFGAVFAHEATKKGKHCLVIDQRDHIGGNVYCEDVDGIRVHKYGAHIFHTSNQKIWDYMNQFATFNHYVNAPVAIYNDELYNLPFNMNTFSKLWGIKTPKQAKAIIEQQRIQCGITNPQNLEEQALSLVGRDVYEKLVKGYTQNSGDVHVMSSQRLLLSVCQCDLLTTTIILMIHTRGFRSADIPRSWRIY